jgi:hypothetical protein
MWQTGILHQTSTLSSLSYSRTESDLYRTSVCLPICPSLDEFFKYRETLYKCRDFGHRSIPSLLILPFLKERKEKLRGSRATEVISYVSQTSDDYAV